MLGLFLVTQLIFAAQSASSCQLPEDLRGVWISSDKGFLRMGESVIHNYPVTLPGTSSIDLQCTENNGTHFMLKSSQDIDVFSIKVSVYTCMSFVQVTQNNYIYYIGTPVDPMVGERVFANSNELNVTMTDVCTALNTENNMYSLIKNVSSEAIVKTNCPSILRNSFASLTVEENGVQNACGNGVINGCLGSTEVVISTRLSCHSNSFISDYLSLTCLFHRKIGDVIYLYSWTENVSYQTTTTHGFICMEITQDAEWTTFRLFNDTCSDVSPSLNFLTLKSNLTTDTCQPTTQAPPPNRNTNHANRPKMKASTNWAIYFAIVVCIIIIIGFIFIIIKFFRKQMCDFFGKKPPPQERAVSFTNIEAKSTETLDTQT